MIFQLIKIPTPVSALIHAATMVTAGVFLLIRSSPLFEQAPLVLMVVTIFGSLTALIAATIGVVQDDLKKVVAYSTCSQLGFMVVACGLSQYSVALFHLMNHAFFKALLFLSAGSVIHVLFDEQDTRKMGGLGRSIPLTYIMVVVGSWSLMGFPYLTGFYSKDLILEWAYDQCYITFAYWLADVAAFLTTVYSIRLVHLTFLSNTNSRKEVFVRVHEGNWSLVLPLVLLALGSLFVGYLVKEAIWFFQMTTYLSVPCSIKLMPVFFSWGGMILVIAVYSCLAHFFRTPLSSIGRISYTFLCSAWQFNYILNHFLVKGVWRGGHLISYRTIDKGTLELVGPKGVSNFLVKLTQGLSNLQSGLVFNYVLVILIGLVLFIWGVV